MKTIYLLQDMQFRIFDEFESRHINEPNTTRDLFLYNLFQDY